MELPEESIIFIYAHPLILNIIVPSSNPGRFVRGPDLSGIQSHSVPFLIHSIPSFHSFHGITDGKCRPGKLQQALGWHFASGLSGLRAAAVMLRNPPGGTAVDWSPHGTGREYCNCIWSTGDAARAALYAVSVYRCLPVR